MTKTNKDLLPPFIESSIQGIIIFKNGKNKYANPKSIEILGYSIEEISGFELAFLINKIYPQDIERIKHILELHKSDLDFEEMIECRFETQSGLVKWLKVLVKSLVFKGERYLIQNIEDITDQKIYEAKLIENEKRYKNFIEQTSEGISYLAFKEPLDINCTKE
ncbi:MAG: PAS domain S-box protein [Ignavibacteria bacterium]